MKTPDNDGELRPSIDLPVVYQTAEIDPDLCRQFAEVALPLMVATTTTEMFHVCDRDAELSALTQLIFDKTVETVGEFKGPVFATTTGYNLPPETFGASNLNSYHSDNCNSVAIVSASARASLHLAWLPILDHEGVYLKTEPRYDNQGPLVKISRGKSPLGFVRPIKVVDCKPGTIVRIDQEEGDLTDDNGYRWQFNHGLYDARGQRVALQFRDFNANTTMEQMNLGHKPRHATTK